MAETAAIPGTFAEMVALFRDATPMTASHWNVVTGEVFRVRNSRRLRADVEAFEERLFAEEGWHEVPFQESDEAYQMAVTFVDELRPGKGRSALLRALEQPKPFRAFRAALGKYPGLKRRYAKAQEEEARYRLVEFCLANELTLAAPEFGRTLDEIEAKMALNDREQGLLAMGTLSLGRRD